MTRRVYSWETSWHLEAEFPALRRRVDPIDGTTNLANGFANSISVMAASERSPHGPPAMKVFHPFTP